MARRRFLIVLLPMTNESHLRDSVQKCVKPRQSKIADAGQHLALGLMAVADEPLTAILRLDIGMLGEELGDLALDGLAQQGPCPAAQNLGERILECPWLNQSQDVILETAYHSFSGEVRSSSNLR